MKYAIHKRAISVQRLSFHQEGKQFIYFKGDDEIQKVMDRQELLGSMFLAWFELNKTNELAKQKTYEEIPEFFIYDSKLRQFRQRKTRARTLGRINHVPRRIEDGYYMRVLLNYQRGPTCFEDLRTVEGAVCATYKEACEKLGLLDDDQEYIDDIRRSSMWATAIQLCNTFVVMLESDSLTQPEVVWENTWELLSDDIQLKKRVEWHRPDLLLSDDEKKSFALHEIDKLLRSRGSSLGSYRSMPSLPENLEDKSNALIEDEKRYDREKLREDNAKWIQQMTPEQKKIYDDILSAVDDEVGRVFFVNGFGGTGKTFLWRSLSANVRSKGNIVLNVASSGIASLLLPGGRTAHSRFGIPLTPDEGSTCSIVKGSDQAKLIEEAKLIIWDEAPMMSRYCFESLDRSLNDICGKCEGKLFGGKNIVFGGDFRQILPVINGGTRTDVVMSALNSSYIWDHCTVYNLTKNMRLMKNTLPQDEAKDAKEFSEWILKVGDGKLAEPNDGEALIDIPEDFLISHADDPIQTITREVYGDPRLLHNKSLPDPEFYQSRAILCPINNDVDMINEHMLKNLEGEERIFLSSDSLDPSDTSSPNNPLCTIDFLNSINIAGMPSHVLRLKVGCPVMLLRNIDPKEGLMNGTRLQITRMAEFIIEAVVITGDKVGDIVHIPRLLITPSDVKLPFKMRRRQLPLRVAYAITINKSQGQSLENVGLYLQRSCFSHGQLYVAVSRVTSKKGLKVLILDKHGKPYTKTINVVYKEVFAKLQLKL